MTEPHAETIAQLMALAEAPEPEARKILAPMLNDLTPLPQQHWTKFPVRSVVALILLRAGHHNEAVLFAAQSLEANHAEMLAQAVMGECRTMHYNTAIHALHHRRPDLGRSRLNAIIAVLGRYMDVFPERSFVSLLDFVDDVTTPRPPSVRPEGRPSVLSLGVWGEQYIADAERLFLPCCLATGNIPELSKAGTVYFRIHTAEADVDRVRALPVIKELASYAVIDVCAFPKDVMGGTSLFGKSVWSRMIQAAHLYADLMFGRSLGADILYGGSDWLVANKCYSTAKRLLQSGYEAVVVQPIRSLADKIEGTIEAAGCRTDMTVDIPSDLLYRASLDALHPSIFQSFMKQTPTHVSTDPIQFCFPAAGGFSLRSLQLSILAAATGRVPADLGCDFHTSDTRLLSDLLVGLDRSKACFINHHMPGELNYTAVDDLGSLASFGNFELSPAGAVRSISKWMVRDEDVDHFIWAAQQKFDYPFPPGLTVELPEGCRREDEAIAEITALLEADRPALLASLDLYRRQGATRNLSPAGE